MILLTDLDHTLADASWRDPQLGNWDEYHALSQEDKPIMQMVNLIRALRPRMRVICVTSRPTKWRKLSVDWMIKYNIYVDELLMRPENDFRKSPELKLALTQSLWEKDASNIIAIDDREDVLTAYASVGIRLLLRKV